MRATVALVVLVAAAAAQAAPPPAQEHAELARQVHRLDHAVSQQQDATRQLHEKVHALEQAQKQDAARLQRRDRAIEALHRQLQEVQRNTGAPAAPASGQ